ncbi:MAG: L,D-transpeptidase [Candidatus Woesearchaeota archaeon]
MTVYKSLIVALAAIILYTTHNTAPSPIIPITPATVTTEVCESKKEDITTYNTNATKGKKSNETLEVLAQEYILTKKNLIIVDKSDHNLKHYIDGKIQKEYEISIGIDEEDKGRIGDKRTPEGVFFISGKQIVDKDYTGNEKRDNIDYLFKKYLGIPLGQFGTRIMRLQEDKKESRYSTGSWKGILIHGLRFPPMTFISRTIYQTKGCIGLSIRDVQELYPQIPYKTTVIIKK